MACHCAMCGVRDAGKNNVRNDYLRHGIYCFEEGRKRWVDCRTKQDMHQLYRTRSKRAWRMEIPNDDE
jgi:hypothetical protein